MLTAALHVFKIACARSWQVDCICLRLLAFCLIF